MHDRTSRAAPRSGLCDAACSRHARFSRPGPGAPSSSPTRTHTRLPTTTLARGRSSAERSRRATARWLTHCAAWRAATAPLRSHWPPLPNPPVAGGACCVAAIRGLALFRPPYLDGAPGVEGARFSAGQCGLSARAVAAWALVADRERAGLALGSEPAGEWGHELALAQRPKCLRDRPVSRGLSSCRHRLSLAGIARPLHRNPYVAWRAATAVGGRGRRRGKRGDGQWPCEP